MGEIPHIIVLVVLAGLGYAFANLVLDGPIKDWPPLGQGIAVLVGSRSRLWWQPQLIQREPRTL